MRNNFFCQTAPGTYMNEKVVLEHGPSFSFGVKSIHEKISDTPGNIIKHLIRNSKLRIYRLIKLIINFIKKNDFCIFCVCF